MGPALLEGRPWRKYDRGGLLPVGQSQQAIRHYRFHASRGQKLIQELAAKSDILIENFKVGGLAAYGLDYDSLKVINPHLIYCSITGFGQTGPYAKGPGMTS